MQRFLLQRESTDPGGCCWPKPRKSSTPPLNGAVRMPNGCAVSTASSMPWKPGQYVRLSATPERLPLMLATAALYVTESGNWQEYELDDHLTAIRRKAPFTPSCTPVRKRKWPE